MKKLDKNLRIGIWGFGKMGKSATDYLQKQGYSLSIMDKRIPTAEEQQYLQEKNIIWYSEKEQEMFFNSCDHIISSPGINISPSRYATHKDKWIHELDFFYQHFNKPIIAITGSIGKTSVTHILAQIFKKLEIPVAVGGNIGIPTFDLIDLQNNVDYALLEVSSFQLMHCTKFAPTLAIWTNFYPNHLDYHATEDEYFAAKSVITQHQVKDSYSLIPLSLREKVAAQPSSSIRAYFSITMPSPIDLHATERLYYIANNTIMRLADNINTPLIKLTPALQELSFIDNILVLVGVCDLIKLDFSALHTIASTTQLPAHRIEKICTINDVTFYNDSKGTTTVSTLAAVEKLKNHPLHLFLGGLSKGIDRSPFIVQLKNQVKHIYCFGKEADELYNMCVQNGISATKHINLNCAVDTCITTLQSGDCVLLSPAGSSFDLYENYEHRGNHFKELIATYLQRCNP